MGLRQESIGAAKNKILILDLTMMLMGSIRNKYQEISQILRKKENFSVLTKTMDLDHKNTTLAQAGINNTAAY